MNTYQEADEFLGRGRSHDHRPLAGSATSLERRSNDTIAVRYHETDVVTYHRDGGVVLDSGGWTTHTTKARMTEYSPVSIFQRNGLWYIQACRGEGLPLLFADGVTVKDGRVSGDGGDIKRTEAAKRRVDRMVSTYIAGYLAHLREVGHGEAPDDGDCWYCRMHTDNGKTLGDAAQNVQHLIDHCETGYYVPSLLLNAAIECNYGGGPAVLYQYTNGKLKRGDTGRWALTLARDALRAYFRRRKRGMVEYVISAARG